MKLTHIVPRFWPQIDGLGDYARLLGDRLLADHGIASRYVVGDPAWKDAGNLPPSGRAPESRAVAAQSVDALIEAVDGTSVIVLHYVGYGYHNRGVPFFINRAMRRWKSESPSRRLVVVFHELWASGPPWKSECYLGFVQKHLVCELHKLADASFASVPRALRKLNAIEPGKTILHPIPSGISTDSAESRGWHSGGPVTAALFGLSSQREVSLRKHLRLVAALNEQGLLGKINVIGKGAAAGSAPSSDVRLLQELVPGEKIRVVPDATPEEAGAALADSDMILSFYPSRWLCKSSSALAAMGNGVIPVLPEGDDLELLSEGREVLVCDGGGPSVDALLRRVKENNLSAVGRAARAWYLANADWPILSGKFAEMLRAIHASGAGGESLSELSGRYDFLIHGALK